MLVIRNATEKDIDAIYDSIIAIASHHDQEQFVQTSKEELLKSGFGKSPKFGVLLAEMDGDTAGFLSFTWEYSIWLGGKYMNIDDLFVYEQFRGKSIGKILMKKAQAHCLSQGVLHLRWEVEENNVAAIDFYQGLGVEFKVKGICHWHAKQ